MLVEHCLDLAPDHMIGASPKEWRIHSINVPYTARSVANCVTDGLNFELTYLRTKMSASLASNSGLRPT